MKPWEEYQQAESQPERGPWEDFAPQAAAPKSSGLDFSLNADKVKAVGQGIKDAAGGVVRSGMGLASNLMRPFEAMIPGGEDGSSGNAKRMARVDSRFRNQGYDPDSGSFQGGKLVGDITATLPIGGAIGKVATKAGLPALGTALSTAGFRTGLPAAATKAGIARNAALRVGAGATVGAGSTAVIDPNSAGLGAVIGGALPHSVKALGYTGGKIAKAVKYPLRSDASRNAGTILSAAGVNSQDAAQAMRNKLMPVGPSILPESIPTAPQLLQNPVISQLQRTVKAMGDSQLGEREAAQNIARLRGLDRISPVNGTVQQAAENMGNSIERFALPANRQAADEVSKLYMGVDPAGESGFMLPFKQMNNAGKTYLGPGTFGSGSDARKAIQSAKKIGLQKVTQQVPLPQKSLNLPDDMPVLPPIEYKSVTNTVPRPVPFEELQNLRSSIGEAANAAQVNGRNKEFGALSKMIAELDAGIEKVAAGRGEAGEYFPPDMVKRWRDANSAHAARKNRFETGPQAGMFRQGGDGQRSVQGAELAGKFFNSTRSQVEDAQAFKRLAGDNKSLLPMLKNYAVTDAANQTNRLGTLSNSKFNNWRDARSGALRETMAPEDMAMMEQVGRELKLSDAAEELGRSSGSDTVQKANNVLKNGLIDNPLVSLVGGKIPLANNVLSALRESAKKTKAQQMGGLLANPEEMDAAIEQYIRWKYKGLLGDDTLMLANKLAPTLYRAVPPLLSSRSTK